MVWTTNDEPAPIRSRNTIPILYPTHGKTLKVRLLGDLVGVYVHYVKDIKRFLDCGGPGCRLCDKWRREIKAYGPCLIWAKVEKTGAIGWKKCVLELPEDKAKPFMGRSCRGLVISVSKCESQALVREEENIYTDALSESFEVIPILQSIWDPGRKLLGQEAIEDVSEGASPATIPFKKQA